MGVVTDFGIKQDEDWTKLKVLSMDQGSMADTIEAARGVVDHYKGEVPVVITIFNPLTTAAKIGGDKKMCIRDRPCSQRICNPKF